MNVTPYNIPTEAGGSTAGSLVGGGSMDWLSAVLNDVTNTADKVGNAYLNLATIDTKIKASKDAEQKQYLDKVQKTQGNFIAGIDNNYVLLGGALLLAYLFLKG